MSQIFTVLKEKADVILALQLRYLKSKCEDQSLDAQNPYRTLCWFGSTPVIPALESRQGIPE